MKGGRTDLSKYEIPLEKDWHLSKTETFRMWILYLIKEEEISTKQGIISSLKETFQPEYVPILSELRLSLGRGIDFDESFGELVKPLADDKLLTQGGEGYVISDSGKTRVSSLIKKMRFGQLRSK